MRRVMKAATARLRALRFRWRVVVGSPGNRGRRLRQGFIMVRFEIANARGRPLVVPFANRSRVVARKRGDSSSRVPLARFPDWGEMTVWQQFLRHGDLFFDVGANVGLYSLVAGEVGARVVAFEPAPDMVEALIENLAVNRLSNVDVRRVALLDRVGTALFGGVDPNRRKVAVDSASNHPNNLGAGTTVELSTLDDEARDGVPRGMKIDVEGFERLVLMGGQALLRSDDLQLVQLEWNSTSEAALNEGRGPLADVLVKAGFELFQWSTDQRQLLSYERRCPPYGRDVIAGRGEALPLLQRLVLEGAFA